MFIVFEGIDGSGKTTMIDKIYSFLSTDLNKKCIKTSEPRTNLIKWSEKILDIIINEEISPQTQALLVNAIRYEHINIIKNYINQGYIVLCDRFFFSTIAYQGFLMKCDIKYLETIHNLATNGFMPNITYLLDIDPEISKTRMANRENLTKFDNFDIEKMKILQNGFQECITKYKNTVKIDANLGQDDVFLAIKEDILSRL